MKIGIFDIQLFADIGNSTSDTVVVGTADADDIINEAIHVTIQALGGNDIIVNRSDTVINKSILDVTIISSDTEFLSQTDTINVVIDGGDGDDTITNIYDGSPDTGATRWFYSNAYYEDQCSCHVSINGGTGDDNILNSGYTANLYNGHNSSEKFYTNISYGNYVTIDGGDGNDTIKNTDGDYVNINGGAGDDYICNSGIKRPIVIGGASPDYMDLLSSSISDNFIVADEVIDIDDVAMSFGYNVSFGHNVSLDGNSGNDTIQSVGGYNVTLNGGNGDDILIGRYDNFFVYNSGNDTIQNYQSGEILIFDANYTGWTNEGNDLILNAAEGSVRINDAKNKLVEVADANGNVLAHVYLANDYEGIIDGRGYGAYEVIVGSDNVNNQIYADTSGSSLYGGNGNSNDELYGNSGVDEYVYSYGNGQDNIFNAGAEDAVNLDGVSLEQITTAQILDNGVNVQFTDGGALNISGQVGTFKLSGQSYGADYQNKSWYAK